MNRIGLIVENFDAKGGCEIVTQRLYDEFLLKKKDCFLISLNKSTNRDCIDLNIKRKLLKKISRNQINYIIKRLKEYNIETVIIQVASPLGLLFSVNFLNKISIEFKTFVVLHNSPKSYITFYKSNFTNIKILLKNLKIKLINIPIIKMRFHSICKNKSITFVTLSEGNKKELFNFFKIKSETIGNIILKGSVQNIDNKKNEIVYLGRLDNYQKNISYLIDVWNKVEKKGWHLNIVGKGPDKNQLQKYVKKNKVTDISFIDGIAPNDVLSFLNSQKVLILTSNFEGFPTVFYEAMSVGNAIISTKFDGFSEDLIKNGCNALIVENKKECIAAIELLINNNDLLTTISRNNIETYKKLSNDLIIEKWNSLL